MLIGKALSDALLTLPTISFQGILHRAVDLEALFGFHLPAPYPQPLPLFSQGAQRRGARYTRIDGPASLYLAMDPQTAYAGANRIHAQAWVGASAGAQAAAPTVLISVRTPTDYDGYVGQEFIPPSSPARLRVRPCADR
jgi:hypothetical protein